MTVSLNVDPLVNGALVKSQWVGSTKRYASSPIAARTGLSKKIPQKSISRASSQAAVAKNASIKQPSSGDSMRSAARKTTGEEVLPVSGAVQSSAAPKTSARSARTPAAVRASPQLATARPNFSPEPRQTPKQPQEPEPELVVDRKVEEARRTALVSALVEVPNFNPENDELAFHGRAFRIGGTVAQVPLTVWKSDKRPRENSPKWLTASEYSDEPAVLHEKVKFLASLLLASRRTIAYTGAGLSVAAGIGMAAVGSQGGAGTGMGVAKHGEPTLAHCVMAELNRQHLLQGWVQQNHDGLPQKAGYRQEDINEIHGSWFDPSNPVVKYTGSLRGDLFDNMEEQAQTADLVLVLGTSLTGLNADQCVTETAMRSNEGAALGSVIISPQKTAQDGNAALRIFAKADDVMQALAKELGLGPRAFGRGRGVKCSADLFPKEDRVLVPYDKNGVRSSTVMTYWDLSRGQKVRISSFNNLKAAHQPNDKGITSVTVGTVVGRDARACSFTISIGGTTKSLGLWWLLSAQHGAVEYLPIVNVSTTEIRAE